MATQESKKLTEEELKKLSDFQKFRQDITTEFGSISILEHNLEIRKENAKKILLDMSSQESSYSKFLEEKYGRGTIDISTGTFIPL